MARNSTLLVLAVVAMLVLQFADCMFAASQNEQSMQCCGSMPCDPSNQSHDCCKGMAASQSPSVLPAEHVTLVPPTMAGADPLPLPQVVVFSVATPAVLAVSQHSPPELYTLHSSFLI